MSKITEMSPSIKIIEYRQEKSDQFYGTCLWARFCFDLDNYTLTTDSDCGHFGYTWYPTPLKESFLHLCSRFNQSYLLEKISRKTVLDENETWSNIEWLIKNLYIDEELAKYCEETGEDLYEELKSAVQSYSDERELIDAIEWRIRHTPLEDKLESYDIYECINRDYPIDAKTITKIYIEEIVPFIKNNFSELLTINIK